MSDFHEGDRVKIVDPKKSKDIYTIMEIKNSKNDKPIYLLKSDSTNTRIVFYDSEASHLEKIN